MQVHVFVVIALSDATVSAPQRLASHTSHTLTFVSPRAFERTRTQADGRALLHTNCTLLHHAQNLHNAQHTPKLHDDAHDPQPVAASASYLHSTHGLATRPARARHCLQRSLKTFSATCAAHLARLAHGTRTHGTARACSTQHPHTPQPNTAHLAIPPPPRRA